MATKVTISGITKLIVVKNGITDINFQLDVYSAWKDWVFLTSGSEPNSKFFPALRTTGGDPTIGSGSIAPYFFFINGWRMRPYEGDHTLNIEGNVAVDESADGFILPTTGSSTVLVNSIFSNNATVLTVQGGSGLSAEEQTKLDELWKIHGLQSGTPLVVTTESREAGSAISQSISQNVDGDTTVTRI